MLDLTNWFCEFVFVATDKSINFGIIADVTNQNLHDATHFDHPKLICTINN